MELNNSQGNILTRIQLLTTICPLDSNTQLKLCNKQMGIKMETQMGRRPAVSKQQLQPIFTTIQVRLFPNKTGPNRTTLTSI